MISRRYNYIFLLCLFLFIIINENQMRGANPSSFVKNSFKPTDPSEVFKQGHNIIFNAELSKSSWVFEQKIKDKEKQIKNPALPNYSYGINLSYRFNIQIYEKWGYFLGSTFGYNFDANISQENRNQIKSKGKLLLPSFLIGLSLQATSSIKISFSNNFSLDRYLGFNWDNKNIALNMNTIHTAQLNFEYFYYEKWAIVSSFSYKNSKYYPSSNVENSLLDIDLQRSDINLQFGMSYYKI